MLSFIVRMLWRLFIFTVGVVAIWLTVFELAPFADARLPFFVVLLLLYCLVAYIIIPALIRLFRLVIKPDHIPLYASTGDGWPSDPVNIAIIAKNREHLEHAMHEAGWYTADEDTLKNMLHEGISIIFNKRYETAPMSNLYLFNRSQDIGFEIPTNDAGSARTRHHVRFWRLEEPAFGAKHANHYTFWAQKLRHLFHIERELWIGAATEDTHPIGIRWRTGQITHRVSRHDHTERDFIVQSLKNSQHVKRISYTKPGKKLKFRGQQFRVSYTTDGSIQVVQLRLPKSAEPMVE